MGLKVGAFMIVHRVLGHIVFFFIIRAFKEEYWWLFKFRLPQ